MEKTFGFDDDISAIHAVEGQQMFFYHKYSYMNLKRRLEENKQRRLMIQMEKEKEKQFILQRRKEKESNVGRVLKEKLQERQNARELLEICRKTTNDFHSHKNWKKEQLIEQKIEKSRQVLLQSRNRAKQYKTHYQQSVKRKMEEKERRVQDKKKIMEKASSEKCSQYHLKQWKEYEKKLLEKHSGKVEKKDLYETFLKKKNQVNQVLHKYKENKNKIKGKSQRIICQPTNKKYFKKMIIAKKPSEGPVESIVSVDTFGLSKSFKNPQQILHKLMRFVDNKRSVEEPTKDKEFIALFQNELHKMDDDLL